MEDIKKQIHLRRADIVYPELSYRVVGALYDVYNDMGFGYLERVYQRAIACRLKELNIPFNEQVPASIPYRRSIVGKQYLDFLVEDKLVLEIKQSPKLLRAGIDQVNAYLAQTSLKLGILATFSPHGVSFMRLVNLKQNL